MTLIKILLSLSLKKVDFNISLRQPCCMIVVVRTIRKNAPLDWVTRHGENRLGRRTYIPVLGMAESINLSGLMKLPRGFLYTKNLVHSLLSRTFGVRNNSGGFRISFTWIRSESLKNFPTLWFQGLFIAFIPFWNCSYC